MWNFFLIFCTFFDAALCIFVSFVFWAARTNYKMSKTFPPWFCAAMFCIARFVLFLINSGNCIFRCMNFNTWLRFNILQWRTSSHFELFDAIHYILRFTTITHLAPLLPYARAYTIFQQHSIGNKWMRAPKYWSSKLNFIRNFGWRNDGDDGDEIRFRNEFCQRWNFPIANSDA